MHLMYTMVVVVVCVWLRRVLGMEEETRTKRARGL